jgi:hypothetical protein
MIFDWPTFLSALIGTTIPGLVVSIFLLWLHNRSSKSIETYKNAFTKQITEVQHLLGKEGAKYRYWHEQRVVALIEIYGAFVSYLRFLRRQLYVCHESRESMDPYFEFRETLDKNLLFLDDDLTKFVHGLSGELHEFWNWAMRQEREPGINDDEVQRRLDFEIPKVLERLRVRVNQYADPDYAEPSNKKT